MERKYRMTTN